MAPTGLDFNFSAGDDYPLNVIVGDPFKMNVNVNLFLDIDEVLTCTHALNYEQLAFFKSEGAIITALKTHYIFPGVIEFIRFVFKIPNTRVSFFSSGLEKRNRAFVPELLKLAFPNSQPQADVFSRQHLTHGQKDLSPHLKPEDHIENAVLIDDNPDHKLTNGQTLLLLKATHEDTFDDLESKNPYYDQSGYKLIPYMLFSPCSFEPAGASLFNTIDRRISVEYGKVYPDFQNRCRLGNRVRTRRI